MCIHTHIHPCTATSIWCTSKVTRLNITQFTPSNHFILPIHLSLPMLLPSIHPIVRNSTSSPIKQSLPLYFLSIILVLEIPMYFSSFRLEFRESKDFASIVLDWVQEDVVEWFITHSHLHYSWQGWCAIVNWECVSWLSYAWESLHTGQKSVGFTFTHFTIQRSFVINVSPSYLINLLFTIPRLVVCIFNSLYTFYWASQLTCFTYPLASLYIAIASSSIKFLKDKYHSLFSLVAVSTSLFHQVVSLCNSGLPFNSLRTSYATLQKELFSFKPNQIDEAQ